MNIEHHEPTFRYKAALVSEGGPLQYEYKMQSDGNEIVTTEQEVSTASRLWWEGDVLVAAWRIRRPGGEMSISYGHELLDEGRRLRATEQLRENGRETKTMSGSSTGVDPH